MGDKEQRPSVDAVVNRYASRVEVLGWSLVRATLPFLVLASIVGVLPIEALPASVAVHLVLRDSSRSAVKAFLESWLTAAAKREPRAVEPSRSSSTEDHPRDAA